MLSSARPSLILNDTHLPSSAEMRSLDAATIRAGTSSLDLMELAGAGVVAAMRRHDLISPGVKICILCGPGNNGGDGLVIARLLRQGGSDVTVILSQASKYSPECSEQVKRYRALGRVKIFSDAQAGLVKQSDSLTDHFIDQKDLQTHLNEAGLWIDCLLGIGQNSPPRGSMGELVVQINRNKLLRPNTLKIISVDVPTGINPDTGEVYEPHVRADVCVVIQLAKRGLLQSPAFEACGIIEAVDIGIRGNVDIEYELIDSKTRPLLEPRRRSAHKGNFGKVLVIGGSAEMPGAPILSALAALRAGSGLVVMACRNEAPQALPPEMIFKLVSDSALHWTEAGIAQLENYLTEVDALILGPGMGQHAETSQALQKVLALLAEADIPTVLDADGLNHLAKLRAQGLCPKLPPTVLTPHPGEMGRLLGLDISKVQADRYAAAADLSKCLKAVVLLKGAATVIHNGQKGWVNSSGGPFLATPGSGDVLAGIIGSFIGQGLALDQASCLGAFVHGKAGELASADRNGGPIIASDIVEACPRILGSLYG